MQPMELLAPAGGRESLEAAVRCGADAVYLGGAALNARRGAENFAGGALRKAADYCHVRGVKVYLALNTLLFDRELGEAYEAVEAACGAGVDAIIVQDLAVARLVRACAPRIRLHASTQMSVHNADAARRLESLGFSRVVLAREMTAREIAQVAERSALELEAFVHGALCMSVSGQCMLSAMLGGRSGNRGLCAQPCRLPFRTGANAHALSLKDLSLIERIGELARAGVTSLKIEGRMKRPEYVAAAVTACRAALEGKPHDQKSLEAVFSRSGFTDGYFADRRGAGMFGVRRREDVQAAEKTLKGLRALYRDERQSVPVSLRLTLGPDTPAALEARDGDGNIARAAGGIPEPAARAPLTPQHAAALLQKTGGTPWRAAEITCDIAAGLMLPAAAVNALRREALAELGRARADAARKPFIPEKPPAYPPHHAPAKPRLRARLRDVSQLSDALRARAWQISLPVDECLKLGPGEDPGGLLVELPRLLFSGRERLERQLGELRARGFAGALAGNLWAVEAAARLGFAAHGDFGLNIANTAALGEYAAMGLADATLSFELDAKKIAALGGTLPRGILAYGYLPLMALRNCPVRAQAGCGSCGRHFPALTDRKGKRFFLDCDHEVAYLHNSVPLSLSDRQEQISGVDFFTLYFTREPHGECVRIVQAFEAGAPLPGEKTRGLCFRGVG